MGVSGRFDLRTPLIISLSAPTRAAPRPLGGFLNRAELDQ